MSKSYKDIEPGEDFSDSDDTDGKKSDDLTTAQKLMQLVDSVHFFNDPSGTGWAKVDEQCFPVGSTRFKRWLQRQYYQKYNKTPYAQALQDVLDQATGKAMFEAAMDEIHVRVAKKGRSIIVDRYNGITEILPESWGPGSANNINFWQPQGLDELPAPKDRGDGIEMLRNYLNFNSEDDFRLMISWLLAAYNPEISCPVLNFQGEQGSAKTTNSKVLRALIDPSGAMINPAPREERTLVIMAQNSRVLCLDNLSGLKKWLSDALCRICTGTGFTTRRLYTNDEQQIFQVKKPIILNGIDDIATRGDLLDRSIVLNLPTIDPEDRKDEREFWRSFNDDRPFILAALFNALSSGLGADRPNLSELPRMADFAEWITRCETGLDWENGSMLEAYNKNKDNAIETGLDGDYLAVAIQKILDQNTNYYEGTATAIVQKVREVSAESSHKYLPTTRTLKSNLRRLAPALRQVGIDWDYDPNGNQRTYTLERVDKEVPKVSKVSKNGQKQDSSDASDILNGTHSEVMPF